MDFGYLLNIKKKGVVNLLDKENRTPKTEINGDGRLRKKYYDGILGNRTRKT